MSGRKLDSRKGSSPWGTAGTTHLSRDQILDATAMCLQNFGYEATTIRRIALELGCAVGSIYRYFRDKQDLLYIVTQRSLEYVAQFAESGGPINHCERLYLEQAQAAGPIYRLMFWMVCVVDGPQTDTTTQLPDVVNRILTAWGRQLGSIEQARLRWIGLHGHALLGTPARVLMARRSDTSTGSSEVGLRALPTSSTGHGIPPNGASVEPSPGLIATTESPDDDVTLL